MPCVLQVVSLMLGSSSSTYTRELSRSLVPRGEHSRTVKGGLKTFFSQTLSGKCHKPARKCPIPGKNAPHATDVTPSGHFRDRFLFPPAIESRHIQRPAFPPA